MFNWFWFILDVLWVRLSQPDMWKIWLIDEGWLFIFIGVAITIGIIYWFTSWMTRFWPFNRIFLSPKEFNGEGRYIGRKFIKTNRGNWLFEKVVPKEYWDEYVSLVIFFSPILNFDRFLIRDEKKNHTEWKTSKDGKDLIVHSKGLKDKREDLCKTTSDEPVTSSVASIDVFEGAIQRKMDKIEDYGELAIRGSVEAQKRLLERGSMPVSREYYPDLTEYKAENSIKLQKEELEGEEDIESEELERVDKAIRELEVGSIDR